ncbi:MAG: pantetheine-phosphate adenylyltransferase [Dehalococcoidia bacterium]|nr:pantetheine-phosphate adenylyltransferase [Dehalococcoidia bacterium]
MIRATYPGSFDPVTNGHLDIATRAAGLFDELVVGVYDIPQKSLMFSTKERVELFSLAVAKLKNVKVAPYNGLTVDFAKKMGAKVIVRGLRSATDFESEFEMNMMNKHMAPEVEQVFLVSDLAFQFLSARLLKEVANLGGTIDHLVPQHVAQALRQKLGR